MKKYALFLLTSCFLVLSLTLLPIASAKRSERSGARKAELTKSADKIQTKRADAKQASLLPRSLMRAQEDKEGPTPVSATAVRFAVSPPLSEIEQKTERSQSMRRGKAEANQERPEKNVSPPLSGIADTDGALAAQQKNANADVAPNIPATISNFEGLSNQDNADNPAIGGFVFPPDTVGDVGPTQYVQATNLLFRVFTKAGAPLTPTQPISVLFAAMGGRCATSDDGDPIVLYDSFADRWIITQFVVSGAAPLGQCIAISQTGDATGAYYTYDFVYPNNKFNDYPKFGVWPDGYYAAFNQFNLAGTAFLGVGVFAFDRAKLLAGDPTASFIFFDTETAFPNVRSMLPSDADGLMPPPPGAPNIFSYFNANEFTGETDSLRLFEFHADFATPANSTFTERSDSPLAVAPFDPRNPAGLDDIEQPSPAAANASLDSISDRLMNRLQYRNFGAYDSLVVNHTVNVGTGTTLATHQAGVRYYELRRSDSAQANSITPNGITTGGNFVVREQATFAPDANNRWMGSVALDNQGNLAVGYSVSSTSVFPSIRYAGRLANDPLGGLPQGEASIIAGAGVQTNTGSRWGDYSSMNVDPTDDCTFFYTQEYYQTTDTTPANAPFGVNWQTRIGSFKFAECTAPAKGTLQVNVTNCFTGQPLAGARVSIDSNLYGTTLAGGSYLAQLPPGTYSVMASLPNFAPSGTFTATVTNGGTTVVNLCVTPMPVIMTAGSAIVAESCAPASGAIDPGETVTVNFALRNTGSLNTTNLVATLLSTGGVTSPSGSQNYGVLPIGGPPVSRPFTFTADPNLSCGGTLTATLQLQDGSNNLGTVTFTFTLGALSAPLAPVTYSSGDIAVPIPDSPDPGISIPISVGDTGEVSDVNVRVRLNHTFDGDLQISLVHPDGTVVPLSNNRGGAGENFGTGTNDCSGTPTVFDDSAGTAISAGVAPFAASFRPETPLAALNGKQVNGTWMLRIVDTGALDTGTVGCVQLEISRQMRICCPFTGPPDIDPAGSTLVSESCPPANSAIDPGERVTVNFNLRNNGLGSTSNLVATLLSTGGVIAPSGPQSYGVLDPAGANRMAGRNFSFTASGSCGGMITTTFQLQDGANNLGTVSFTFQLGVTVSTTSTFANATPIIIPATGTGAGTGAPANPYPSTINVAGITQSVSKVTVTLRNMNHTFPSDVDVLLVGPGGQRLLLMSDAGGGNDIVNVNLTFDDMAATLLPAAIVSGTYRPTNIGTGDAFPAPAPAGPYTDPQLLSVFNGVNPNGTWSLYVVDDLGGDVGNINMGWELNITTSAPVCTTPCGGVRLLTTTALARSGSNVVATITVQNQGNVAAANVTLTQATLSSPTNNGQVIPQTIGALAPGASATRTVTFTNPGTGTRLLRIRGTYTGGTFGTTGNVTLP